QERREWIGHRARTYGGRARPARLCAARLGGRATAAQCESSRFVILHGQRQPALAVSLSVRPAATPPRSRGFPQPARRPFPTPPATRPPAGASPLRRSSSPRDAGFSIPPPPRSAAARGTPGRARARTRRGGAGRSEERRVGEERGAGVWMLL